MGDGCSQSQGAHPSRQLADLRKDLYWFSSKIQGDYLKLLPGVTHLVHGRPSLALCIDEHPSREAERMKRRGAHVGMA